MRIFANKAGAIIDTAGGTAPLDAPNGTVVTLEFDEETNPGITRLVGEQAEWPFILITADSLSWHDKPIPIQPDSDRRNEQKARQALIDRLFSASEKLSETDVRTLLQLLSAQAGLRPTPVDDVAGAIASTRVG